MTSMFISLQQWACPPNLNYTDTTMFSTLTSQNLLTPYSRVHLFDSKDKSHPNINPIGKVTFDLECIPKKTSTIINQSSSPLDVVVTTIR